MHQTLSPQRVDQVLGSHEAWNQFVMDRLPLGVITVDHQRRITYLNPHAAELTGWGRQEALGHSCGEVLKGGRCASDCPLIKAMSHGRDTMDVRTTLTNVQGEVIPIRLRTVALYDENDQLMGAVEAFIDIRPTVALEEERQRTLSYFAHDMKSPLVGALGFMNRLLDGKAGELNPKQRDYLQVVRGELGHVQELVMDYLDVLRVGSRQASLNLARMEMGSLLEELTREYGALARGKGMELELSMADDLPPVMADKPRLRRALANLVDNAVKFSRQGRVEVECRPVGEDKIRVLVCDRGPGLKPGDQEKLFTPFFRGSAGKEVEGTGLGLAAVRAIVEAHGGEVFASNRQGGGACFSMVLPLKSRQPVAASGPGRETPV